MHFLALYSDNFLNVPFIQSLVFPSDVILNKVLSSFSLNSVKVTPTKYFYYLFLFSTINFPTFTVSDDSIR